MSNTTENIKKGFIFTISGIANAQNSYQISNYIIISSIGRSNIKQSCNCSFLDNPELTKKC